MQETKIFFARDAFGPQAGIALCLSGGGYRAMLFSGAQVIRADQGVVTGVKPVFLTDADWQEIQNNATTFEREKVRRGADNSSVRPGQKGNTPLYYEVSIPLR